MPILSHTLGYPRIGPRRELKSALEGYWNGSIPADALDATTQTIRQRNWQEQFMAGIDIIPSNDFSLYDHVLDTACLVGAVPKRYGWNGEGTVPLDQYFAMARGKTGTDAVSDAVRSASADVIALPLRKWFNTNYHYIVPEFARNQEFRLASTKPFDEFRDALEQGIRTKPVLLGPVSFLHLGSCAEEPFDKLNLLPQLLPVYAEILAKLKGLGAEWVQLDEPMLVLDLTNRERYAMGEAYGFLRQGMRPKMLLGTYFGDLRENLPLALHLPIDALHLDATHGKKDLAYALEQLPEGKALSIGIVDGRNVWKNNLSHSLALLEHARGKLGDDRLLIATSSSLLHVPLSLDGEDNLDPAIRDRLAFAREKLSEIAILQSALDGDPIAFHSIALDEARRRALSSEEETHLPLPHLSRRSPGAKERAEMQRSLLNLPSFPTTTIGSFPQTQELRKLRANLAKGRISDDEYALALQQTIRANIALQEELGLDVLVHGEPERDDMVAYFADRLHGMTRTKNGWVQSYGSRYVRPPIIHDRVGRRSPLTVKEARFAQSCTEKPVKGMLTGPVTLLQWSFPPEDQSTSDVCSQLALTIRDEIRDLQEAGIRIIQVDEPALREGLPLRTEDREQYLRWASACIRLAISSANPETQIHTHMCYADFRDIGNILGDLDVDVISLEAARSRMELLPLLAEHPLPHGVGPGVWDVHSQRIPSVEEMVELLRKAQGDLPYAEIWANPDCGLKTRRWGEVMRALQNMVAAAKIVRGEGIPTAAATPANGSPTSSAAGS